MLRTLPIVAGSAALLLTLSACGGSSSGSTTSSGGQSANGYGQRGGSGAQGRGMPGAFGKIAARSGKTLQVQSQQNGQTAVSFTGTTAISREVSASKQDLKVGDCVMAVAGSSSSSGSTLAARTVRITGTKGTCTVGFGGSRPGGFPSGARSGAPSGAPSRGAGESGRGRFGGAAFGTVSAVTADGFTVKQARPGASSGTTTVTVSGSTTWTATAKATAAALKVGRCVSAQGRTDDTGAVTANRISISDPVGGQCTGGSGFGFGRPPGAGRGSGSGQSAAGA